MFDLYTFTTPNGRKASVMLEEVGLPYTPHVIDIRKGDQFTPAFLAINPNGKIPALVDNERGIKVFESGAILIYLAERTGQLLPSHGQERYAVLQWVMFQMGGVGPMSGQLNHFKRSAPEPIAYAIDRYTKEILRIYGVLDKQLSTQEYIAGDYSIADIATYPWIAIHDAQGLSLAEFPNLHRWLNTVAQRPAVARGMKVPSLL